MRPPTSNELMELLVRDLLAGRESGDRLPSERETAGRYGVSRPVVREALRALQERGLVEILPGRGTFVRGPSADDLARPMDRLLRDQATPRDLVEARTMLECRTAQLAAERATDADVARIACAYEAFESASSVHDRVRADLAFHGAIAVAAHNPVLDTMFRSISTFVIELMLRSLSDPEVVAKGAPYHGKVLAAIRRRDSKRAGAAMVAHVELAAALYGADYGRSLEALARDRSAFLDTYRPDWQEERACRSPLSRP